MNDSTVLRTTPEAVRAFETEYPMFKGYGDYLWRQGKLVYTDQEEEHGN